tara:strand:- start:452 stop:1714 length:1263 start_codon:yes stop_codon:yes gene_type:complete
MKQKNKWKTLRNELLAIIPAAGSGIRFGGSNFGNAAPDYELSHNRKTKQYAKLNGYSVLERTVKTFLDSEYVSEIVIAIKNGDTQIKQQNFYNSERVKYVVGGDTRMQSINNALNSAELDHKYVVTHDAVRPNISTFDIYSLYSHLLHSEVSCAFFWIPVTDSIREVTNKDLITWKHPPPNVKRNHEKTRDRNKFYLVQTPQISKFNDLKKSIQKCIDDGIDAPDESFAIEYAGFDLAKVPGKQSNIKITYSEDLELLDNFLVRSGIGFDLHRYESGDGIILGGYKIDCPFRIIAHSDGDVLLHSIADSILGAAGLPDIGSYFPDTDKKNKNMDSRKIIACCHSELNKIGLSIYNVDATIICEEPKINPHRGEIINKLSQILKIPVSNISIKATTSEKIGIIGNHEAIAVQSIVNLKEIS